MLVWRKITTTKWVDAWEERLSFLGPERLVITRFSGSKRARLEMFDLTPKESEILLHCFAGQTRNLSRSSADWVKSVIRKVPISIRGRLQIITDGSKSDRQTGLAEIHIPAGLAFGTGEHATTATCLRMLCDLAPSGGSWDFLDVGTGTGILAIAAAKLGARRVIGIDLDSTAVSVAKQNAKANAVDQIRFRRIAIQSWSEPQRFEIVCANLYGDTLVSAMSPIWSTVAEGGNLIASGILRDQTEAVRQSIGRQQGEIRREVVRGKWVTMLVRKPVGEVAVN